jgi:hypothetical protein
VQLGRSGCYQLQLCCINIGSDPDRVDLIPLSLSNMMGLGLDPDCVDLIPLLLSNVMKEAMRGKRISDPTPTVYKSVGACTMVPVGVLLVARKWTCKRCGVWHDIPPSLQ